MRFIFYPDFTVKAAYDIVFNFVGKKEKNLSFKPTLDLHAFIAEAFELFLMVV